MFTVSTGRTAITPESGYPMAGYGVDDPRLSAGTNEPLMARCLVIWDDGSPHVIVTADVLAFGPHTHTAIRDQVVDDLGVDSSAFVLTATHTHNGPVLLEGLDPFIAYGLEDLSRILIYTDRLVRRISALIARTLRAPRTPCMLEYAVLDENFSFNREGLPTTERDVPVLIARDFTDQPRAVLFSYGAHPVAAGAQDSFDPDYPAQAIKRIEEAWPGCAAQFLLGPAGDQNPTTIADFASADAFGDDLGATIANALEISWRPLSGPIDSMSDSVALPLDISTSPSNLTTWRASFLARAGNPALIGFARRHALRMVQLIDGVAPELIETAVDVPLQRWRFSGDPDLVIVFSGGEVVSGYGAVLRSEFGGSDGLWFLPYANEVPCYVPSDELLSRTSYAGGIDADFPAIGGGSMSVYDHIAHFRPGVPPGSGGGVEATYLDAIRALV